MYMMMMLTMKIRRIITIIMTSIHIIMDIIIIIFIIIIMIMLIIGKGGRNLDQEIVEAAVSSRSPAVLRLILMRCFVIIIVEIIVFCNCQQLS